MSYWMNLGQQFRMNSLKYFDKIALKDSCRSYTYFEVNDRVNKLVYNFIEIGLVKGNKVAVVMENSIEFIEIYLATAKMGLVIVPINFRLLAKEIAYIVSDSDAKILIFGNEFFSCIREAKKSIVNISKFILVGGESDHLHKEYISYDSFVTVDRSVGEAYFDISSDDPWVLIYTSGTTGKPKGVLRSHISHISFYMINTIDFGFSSKDVCMNVMPLCHINSVFFSFIFLYIGSSVYVHQAQYFNPTEVLRIVEKEKITFISLIPTHYSLILSLSDRLKNYDTSSIRKLLCSSAAVRKDMKFEIMKFFPNVELYEAYGSTEAGIVTILKPEDQIKKIGSIGYESLGTDRIKILDENKRDLEDGCIGEIYSKSPMLFSGYHKFSDISKSSFNGWFSAGDLGYRDVDGFYVIIDRKDNMIITGGEHVYPSEVEEVFSSHYDVLDVAVIGLSDPKWGEKVVAIVVASNYYDGLENELFDWCKKKLSGYKRPKEIFFIEGEDMPRTATGKILHRVLRDRFVCI